VQRAPRWPAARDARRRASAAAWPHRANMQQRLAPRRDTARGGTRAGGKGTGRRRRVSRPAGRKLLPSPLHLAGGAGRSPRVTAASWQRAGSGIPPATPPRPWRRRRRRCLRRGWA
jgi:hypothetical protein